MQVSNYDKLGGLAIIVGSLLFALYSSLFPILLPIGTGSFDYVAVVLSPAWRWLALAAFVGILLMLVGFYAVYARISAASGALGTVGFLLIELAYLLQACKVTWELFLYPIIAEHAESAFLLRDMIIKHDALVATFRIGSQLTIFAGVVLFCLALHRSRAYPKLAAPLIFCGAVVYAIGPFISTYVSITGIFVLAAGCALLGLRLLKPATASNF